MRNDDPYIGKYGMTEIELNKVLEKNGFVKIRDRSSFGGPDDEVRAAPAPHQRELEQSSKNCPGA